MNLPFILDIGIGLFSIYLTLSLLASELQELLTTLLQWRAQHLKQSIETLLAGESKPLLNQTPAEVQLVQAQITRSKELANCLYNHPLIRSLDHESKGLIGRIAEQVSQWTNTSKVFSGKASGPSYLSSDVFSTALLETLKTGEIIQTLSEQKLNQFVDKKLAQSAIESLSFLRRSTENELLLERELQAFQAEVHSIVQTFSDRQTTLSISVDQISSAVKRFRLASEAMLPAQDFLSLVFLKQLAAIEQEIPSLLQQVTPGTVEVMSALDNMAWVVQSLQAAKGDYQTIVGQLPDATLRERFQSGYDFLQTMNQTVNASSQEQDAFQLILSYLVPHLRDSLTMLAKQAQQKISALDQGANQLQKEVALWFDRSMDRSAGVYKRNAKGVAIIIGMLIAVTTNTDTLHIINQLAKDSTLRAAYSQVANELVSRDPNAIACLQAEQSEAAQVDCLNAGVIALHDTLNSITNVPIGWNATNWREQWQSQPEGAWLGGLKVLGGWLISAIAISMGAPFWFNLLNKVVNVRNSGKPPASTSQTGSS
jgi:hypothetical protein